MLALKKQEAAFKYLRPRLPRKVSDSTLRRHVIRPVLPKKPSKQSPALVLNGAKRKLDGMTPSTGVRLAVERDRAADDQRIRRESPLPQRMAEHDDAVAARSIFVVEERPHRQSG